MQGMRVDLRHLFANTIEELASLAAKQNSDSVSQFSVFTKTTSPIKDYFDAFKEKVDSLLASIKLDEIRYD